jgi:hypothetical protein
MDIISTGRWRFAFVYYRSVIVASGGSLGFVYALLQDVGALLALGTICTKSVQFEKKVYVSCLDSRLACFAQWRTLAFFSELKPN